ncbi:C-C motif chemokine 21 [Rhynchocyon petersi]
MVQSLALSFLVLVLALYSPGIQGSDGGAQDCCLKYSQRAIPANIVRSYRKQDPSLGCPISAILFAPRKRSQPELCGDPNEQWVQQLMKRLDKQPVRDPQNCGSKNGKKKKGSKGCKSPSPESESSDQANPEKAVEEHPHASAVRNCWELAGRHTSSWRGGCPGTSRQALAPSPQGA